MSQRWAIKNLHGAVLLKANFIAEYLGAQFNQPKASYQCSFSVLHFSPTSWQVERLRQTLAQVNGHLLLNSYQLAPDLIGPKADLPASLQSQPDIAWFQ